MRKAEIKDAKDNELVDEYVRTQTLFALNKNSRTEKYLQSLEKELVSRGVLTGERH